MSKIPDSKKIAKEDSKVALQKAADAKMKDETQKAGTTMTGQAADSLEIDPVKQGMQSQTYN